MMRVLWTIVCCCCAGLLVAGCGRDRNAQATATASADLAAATEAPATATSTVQPPTVTPADTATVVPSDKPTDGVDVTATLAETVTVMVTSAVTPTGAITATVVATVTAVVTPIDTPDATALPDVTVTVTSTESIAVIETPIMTSPTVVDSETPSVTTTVDEIVATNVPTATMVGTATPTPSPMTAIPTTDTAVGTPLPTQVRITNIRKGSSYEPSGAGWGPSAELSPDGTSVAWLVPAVGRRMAQLCIETVATTRRHCIGLPGYVGLPYRLAWSPDSRWLAWSEDPAAQALESDIWLLEVETGEWINRTGDDVTGAYDLAEPGTYVLDYLPMWHPISGELYFWRSMPMGLGRMGLDLMRMDPVGETAPVRVRSLEQTLGTGLISFGVQRFYLDGPSAISPDGRWLATVTAPIQEMNLSPSNGLWLIDLTDDSAAPEQIATSLAWQDALPGWWTQPAVARGLGWTGDGAGLVIAALSNDLRLPLLTAYYVDLASGEVTPVVDFSDVPSRAALFKPSAGKSRPPRYDVPWTVALPDGANVLLLVNDLGGILRLSAIGLPPAGGPPVTLVERMSEEYAVLTRSSRGHGGKVLVYGLLVTTAADAPSR